MAKTTIVIPARNELYLTKCIDSLYEKATGDFEVIVVFDNCWHEPMLEDRPGLTIVHWGERRGMRAAINAGAELGKGKYLLKCDAHVLFEEGFNEKLAEDCDEDWIVTPSRYSLDAENWIPKYDKPIIDYEYLSYPYQNDEEVGLHAKYWWKERSQERKDLLVDENMTFQGSCWFTHMDYFKKLIYPMDEANYGMFIGEPQEVGLKAWLSGGKCMINKKVWYAHLWKGQSYRDLHMQRMGFAYTRVGHSEMTKGNKYSTDFWFNNRWTERKYDLSWLVERFWPVPTWPENRELWTHKPIS